MESSDMMKREAVKAEYRAKKENEAQRVTEKQREKSGEKRKTPRG
jgi:hypothetical protein